MEQLTVIRAWIAKRVHLLAAYSAVLYYFEIIFLMFGLLFLYGKTASIAAGVVLSILLAYHIIQLYYRKRIHRSIQLWVIDVHAAFAAGYLFYCAAGGAGSDPGSPPVIAARAFILAIELPLLYFLAGREGSEAYR